MPHSIVKKVKTPRPPTDYLMRNSFVTALSTYGKAMQKLKTKAQVELQIILMLKQSHTLKLRLNCCDN